MEPRGIFVEPNSGSGNGVQTRTFDQKHAFGVNGGSTSLQVDLGKIVAPVQPRKRINQFDNALQKWEGYVIELRQDTFLARLTPIKGEGPDQEAEIYLSEVEEGDHVLIRPGAVFYWSIGYLDRPSGRIRASRIRFRRLPAWSRRDLETAKAEAENLRELLHDEQ